MRISSTKSSYNFYESFSDLLFCTLVLFIVLILTLALNVNKKVESLEKASMSAQRDQTQAQSTTQSIDVDSLKKQKADAEAKIASLIKIKEELSKQAEKANHQNSINNMELEQLRKHRQNADEALAEARRELDKLKEHNSSLIRLVSNDATINDESEHFLPNQFNGQTAPPVINLAFADEDAEGKKVRCFPVPCDIMRGFSTPILGESEDDALARQQRYATELLETYRNIEPLLPKQYTALISSFSVCGQITSAEDSTKGLGLLLEQNGKVAAVCVDSPAAFAGVQVGDELVSMDFKPLEGYDYATLQKMISTILNARGAKANKLSTHTLIVRRAGITHTLRVKYFPYRTSYVMEMSHVTLSLVVSKLLTPDMKFVTSREKVNTFVFMNNSGLFSRTMFQQGISSYNNTNAVSFGRSELPFSITGDGWVDIGGVRFSRGQFMVILRSIEGAVSIKFLPSASHETIPADFARDVLLPAGFINRTPYYRLNSDSLELKPNNILPARSTRPQEVSIAIAFLNSKDMERVAQGIKLANELLDKTPPIPNSDAAELRDLVLKAEESTYLTLLRETFRMGNTNRLRDLVRNPIGEQGRKLSVHYSGLMSELKKGTDAEKAGEILDAYFSYKVFMNDPDARVSEYSKAINVFMRKYPSGTIGELLVKKGDEYMALQNYSEALKNYLAAKERSVVVSQQLRELTRVGLQFFEEGINHYNDGMKERALNSIEQAIACMERGAPERERVLRWASIKGLIPNL